MGEHVKEGKCTECSNGPSSPGSSVEEDEKRVTALGRKSSVPPHCQFLRHRKRRQSTPTLVRLPMNIYNHIQ